MDGVRGVNAGEFDDKFDAGEDVIGDLDLSAARRPVQDARDVEADRLWLEEATRRDSELDEGTASSSPAQDVIARARSRRA